MFGIQKEAFFFEVAPFLYIVAFGTLMKLEKYGLNVQWSYGLLGLLGLAAIIYVVFYSGAIH